MENYDFKGWLEGIEDINNFVIVYDFEYDRIIFVLIKDWLDNWEINDLKVVYMVCKMILFECLFE